MLQRAQDCALRMVSLRRYRSDWTLEGVSLVQRVMGDYLTGHKDERTNIPGWQDMLTLLATPGDALKPSDSQKQMDELLRVGRSLQESCNSCTDTAHACMHIHLAHLCLQGCSRPGTEVL